MYDAGLSADITSCITEAENCMSLLLSDHNIFDIDTDQRDSSGDFHSVTVSHVSDSCGCEDASEVNKELNVNDCDSQSQYKHKDSDCERGLIADSISNSRLSDVGRISDISVTSSTDAEQSAVVDVVNAHRQHGLHSFCYALHIDIASHIRIEQTEDNADVVRTLQELATVLVNRYIPAVKHWLEVNIHHPWSSVLLGGGWFAVLYITLILWLTCWWNVTHHEM